MPNPNFVAVHLLPASGEYVYDTASAIGQQLGESGLDNFTIMNFFSSGPGQPTDYSNSLDLLQAQHPECQTVSLVVAWFFNSENAANCNIYPSTNFLLGQFSTWSGGAFVPTHWMVSGLTEQDYPGIIPLPALPGTTNFVYGGTPSDPSVVRCIRDLKSRGFKIVFYPFLLGTGSGFPWRGRITSNGDLTQQATDDVAAFMGGATTSDFTRDSVNLTVGYSGNLFDWTYRRMILHYANLCIVAGGVNLFAIGSELRGLEILRGPGWTKAGTTDGSGFAIWDYPFVAALKTLSDDVRSTFDAAGFTKNTTTFENLVVYSSDWSSFMGWQHAGENGQWPHLDQLWAHGNIDFASFDNYLPLTDWTTSTAPYGGLDAAMWDAPLYTGAWPPPSNELSGLGLDGPPLIYDTRYIKGQIERGQYFDWFYNDGAAGAHGGSGLDPLGSALQVTVPAGDRLAQARNPYFANQQILANKQYRWWWNNQHQAVYDNGDGHGFAPHGPFTEWVPNSKSILFLEYGFPAVDKGTNQPNVFFDAKSTESATPYWSIWDPTTVLTYLPRRDDTIQRVALECLYEYWNTDGKNETVGGIPMIQTLFCGAWNWDARPFPTFPIDNSAWGDTLNWQAGDWLNGVRVNLTPPAPTPPPTPPAFESFPAVASIGIEAHIRPRFSSVIGEHVSGRETRMLAYANPYFDIDLTYDVLRADAAHVELQTIAGFFAAMSGKRTPFWVSPPGLDAAIGQPIGTGDGAATVFPLIVSIGPWTGPVYGTSGVSAVYLNGVSQPTGWTVSSGYAPAITFASAPGAGVAITADFGVLWLCRFSDDVQDFEEFMAMLFELQTLRLTTVRP